MKNMTLGENVVSDKLLWGYCLLEGVLELQGIDIGKLHDLFDGLLDNGNVDNLRLEVSGRGNSYPVEPGMLVLVGDYTGKEKLYAQEFFNGLRKKIGFEFNNVSSFCDGNIHSTYAIGRGNIGSVSDQGNLVFLLKESADREKA